MNTLVNYCLYKKNRNNEKIKLENKTTHLSKRPCFSSCVMGRNLSGGLQ